ncbi:MAG TPA: glycosyltransferase family 4 protein [Acidocella sp.]|nr:glycosyltransferase family 4 protein [Acidocella sp.]
MKITHIVRQFSPSVGGLEDSVLNLASAQRVCLGLDARVVTLNRVFGQKETLPAMERIADIPVRRLPWRGSTRYPLALSVLNHLQASDVVHVHAIDFFFDFLALTRPLHRKKMIASTHGGFFHTPQFATAKKIWFNAVTRSSIRGYHRIVACSHSDANLFRPLTGPDLTVIENGIDQKKFWRASSPVPTRTIIYFGRFTRHKRVAMLFPVLAQLRALNPEWRLIVAGREAELNVQQLRAMAERDAVEEAVQFVSAPDDAQLRTLIGQASYFASLSSYEGFGLSAVEAMSAGLFPVLSGIPPFSRLLCERKAGLIVDPHAPVDIAMAMEASVLQNPTAHSRRRAETCDAVREYDWEAVAARYARIYSEVAGGK